MFLQQDKVIQESKIDLAKPPKRQKKEIPKPEESNETLNEGMKFKYFKF